MNGVDWSTMSDETVAALVFALEENYEKIDRDCEFGYTHTFKKTATRLLDGALEEWKRRKLSFKMFGSG